MNKAILAFAAWVVAVLTDLRPQHADEGNKLLADLKAAAAKKEK